MKQLIIAMALLIAAAPLAARNLPIPKKIIQSSSNTPEQIVRNLWKGIPENGLNEFSESALTPDLFELAAEVYDKGGDRLKSWYGDKYGNGRISAVKINNMDDMRISATVTYYYDGAGQHTVILTRDDYRNPVTGETVNEWRIADFDGMYSKLMNADSQQNNGFNTVTEQVVVKDVEPAYHDNPGRGNQIFMAGGEQASFPGGDAALMKWIAANLRYPESAQQNNIQGRVMVQFIVNEDGSIEQPQVLRSVDKALDAEALRVVKLMPRWIPGKNNGVPVRSYYTIPITFKLP